MTKLLSFDPPPEKKNLKRALDDILIKVTVNNDS